MSNKVLLMILDGWGNGHHDKADVISTVHPDYISAMTAKYPHAELRTDGENVGLPDGQMGNSEVGHLNIGAGRVVYQDLVKINRACRDNSILKNPEIVAAFEYAKQRGVGVHFMGLVSDGGVHSSLEHLFKLCDIAAEYRIENTYVHCFMDGRDTDPRSGKGFIQALEDHMAATTGTIATVVGRYYAMDRDKRWERVKVAYDALVEGVGTPVTDMVAAVQQSYDADVTDEFIKPIVRVDGAGKPVGLIKPNDLVVFFNYRNDRAKELTVVLTQEDMPEQGMHTLPLYYCCMTPTTPSSRVCTFCSTRRMCPIRSVSGFRNRDCGSCASPRRKNMPTSLFLERRPRGEVCQRGAHFGRFAESGYLRPPARNVGARGRR